MIEDKLVEFWFSWLLNAAWILWICPILIASIPLSPFLSFRQFISAFAYCGKNVQSSSSRFTVPHKFFCHFYVVGVVWTTQLLVATWCYAYKMTPSISGPMLYSSTASYLAGSSREITEQQYKLWQSVFLLLLMEAQVLRRLFETIYVFKYSPSARMHIFGYLTGLYFYTAAPLSLSYTIAPEAFNFAIKWIEEFIIIGKNEIKVEFDVWGFIGPLIRERWYTWIGAIIFFWGWAHQQRCHAILGLLRENKAQAEAYVVPEGDWFNHVSSPHYLAEIVIYGGLVVVSGCTNLTIWLLFAFVVANLTFVAAETHKWYLRKFEDYPSHRFAIIPLVV